MTLDEILVKLKGVIESKDEADLTDHDYLCALLGAILLELRKP